MVILNHALRNTPKDTPIENAHTGCRNRRFPEVLVPDHSLQSAAEQLAKL
jgi:hypothetical protein